MKWDVGGEKTRDSETAVVKGMADAQYRALSDAFVGGPVGCIDSLKDTSI